MSTYYQDLKAKNPAKYADLALVGNQSQAVLRNMIRALQLFPILNTPAENARLAAAKRLLRNRY